MISLTDTRPNFSISSSADGTKRKDATSSAALIFEKSFAFAKKAKSTVG